MPRTELTYGLNINTSLSALKIDRCLSIKNDFAPLKRAGKKILF